MGIFKVKCELKESYIVAFPFIWKGEQVITRNLKHGIFGVK